MIKLFSEELFNKYIENNETLIVAVSTGIDSMSLFHYLLNLNKKIVVAHVNHKRRKESDIEYEYLKNLCGEKNIPFEGYVMQEVSGNFQSEARKLRYEFFKEVARKYNTDKIILAHHADDQIETIIMRLSRGTSIRGYSGINYISESEGFKIIRPLLYTTRETIKLYQEENGIKYFEDSSNSEDHYTRNKIRHNIIPTLKEINPNFYGNIINYSKDQKEMYEVVDSLALDFIKNKAKINSNSIQIDQTELNKLLPAIKKQIILRCVNIISNNTVELTHERLEKIASFGSPSSEEKCIEIKDDYVLYLLENTLSFERKKDIDTLYLEVNSEGTYNLGEYGEIVFSSTPHSLASKNSYMLCYNDNIFPIIVRNVQYGDKICVNGITKKVSDVLKEHKVPKHLRERQLVVLNSKGIFFIPGILRKETNKEEKLKLFITLEEKSFYEN